MLNKSKRFKVLKYLRACCIVGLFPTEVDREHWTLTVPSITKRCICAASYGLVLLHMLYKNGTLAYAYFFDPDVQLYQLIIHGAVALGTAMCSFWYYVVYISDPALFAAYVKATLTGNIGGPTDPKDRLEKKWTTRLREYSMQDLIAICVPYMAGLAVPIICTSYVYDSSMRLLLYHALPTYLQSWATFGLYMVEEARFIMIMVAINCPFWQLQVISYEFVCRQLQLLMERMKNGTQTSRNVKRSLRRLQLYVSMLNMVNSYLIFTWKLFSISLCILSGYAAIAHFGDHPVFGVMYVFLLFDGTFIYTVIYGKAFKIPQLFDQAATSAQLCVRRDRTGVLRRQIRSIRRTGIRVGDFHQMERTSTLIFMDYVVTNIVSMLVAFR